MKITWRIWLLIIFIAFSLIVIFSIPPLIFEKGVVIKSVDKNSTAFNEGLRADMRIISLNNQQIQNMQDYTKIINNIFPVNETKLIIGTNQGNFILLTNETPAITINDISITKIKTGLDIQGGARALVTAENHLLTDNELDDLISTSKERLNAFGLTDLNIRSASDLSGNKFMVVEIAGSSPSDLENLLSQQGKFEAKIGNDTVFVGGKQDITYVARTGQDAGIYDCAQFTSDSWLCYFRFSVGISPEAADRFAAITKNIPINSSNPEYLSKTIDFYIDDKLTDSLQISKGLQGSSTPTHSIQGSGTGKTRQDAFDSAQENMKKLQTIMKTGSLPFKLAIVKIDRISPLLGEAFVKTILIAGIFAIVAVSVIIFVRYRKIKVSLALLLTSFSELIIILGIAAFINWNLDLPSIAGIIATIGTGVDSQIVILDESRRQKSDSLKERISRALFIIFTSFATAFVSLVPLTGFLGFMGIGAAGAGLLKGFAVTTLIGITVGVFVTRPAFADIIKQIERE